MLKRTEKKTLAAIMNYDYVDDMPTQGLSPRMVRRRFLFLWFKQTEYLETNCNKQGELTSPRVLV